MTDFYHDPEAPVQPDQFAVEFAELLDIYRSIEPKRVLEIGVREGGTLYQWIKHAGPDAQVTAVDIGATGPWGSPHNMVDPISWQEWGREHGSRAVPVIGNSHELATVLTVDKYAPFDFVFIDADHSFAGINIDFLVYGRMVRPGGIVAIHDILRDATDGLIEIWKFWPQIKGEYETKELVSEPGQRSRGIGVVYV